MVVHEVTSPSQRIKDKTVAVAVFGDPYTKDTGIVSALTGGIFEDLTNSRVLEMCKQVAQTDKRMTL